LKKKTILITGIVVALLVAGVLSYRVIASSRSASSSTVQTTTVERGTLTTTLSSSGNTRSGQSATISWQTSGKVGEVTLQAGDTVQADQELAALDPNTLSTDMITAKQDLITAKQTLDDLLNSKTKQAEALQTLENAQNALDDLKETAAQDAATAQQTLATAQATLDAAQKTRNKMNYPHSTDPYVIEKAQTNYLLAKNAYNDALKQYNKVVNKKLTNPVRVDALNNLVNKEAALKTALATYNWYILPYTANDIAQADADLAVAQAALAQAQTNYDSLKNGASDAAIAMAEATLADAQRAYDRVKDGPSADDIAAAQAAVDAAQASLDNANLLAPFAGTITEVDVKTGDLVSNGTAAFRIDDLTSIYVDLEVSEVDLPSLRVGQPTTLEFDAIPDKTYTGEVTDIGMIGSVSQGVVNYPVTVRITNADENIKPGMTASVTIITDQAQDALMVPNKAIHTSNGQHTVTVLFEGQQMSVPVTTGLSNDTMTEVTGGQLKEGDAVVISGSTASTSSTTTSSNQGGGPLGGVPGLDAGGPPPGQ
jgi:HlyD family secretion protein